MRKVITIVLASAILMIAIAALMDPTVRYPYFGVKLNRDIAVLEGSDPITVMISVETGKELLSEEALTEDPAIQDEYTLLMILREDLKAQSESADVTYEVEEMESEQWAWKEAELNKLKARTQVFPSDIALAPSLTYPKESVMASTEVWTPLITSFWPKLPKGFQKAGKSTWQEQVSYVENNPLTGEPVKVNYNLVYKLDKFVNTDRGVLVNLIVLGSIAEGSDVDPSVEVRGTYKGFVLLEPETGRAYGGEYRIEERFHVKQPGLPVLRKTTYQGAKFWRPMFYKMSQQKVKGTAGDAGSSPPPSSGGGDSL